MRMDKFFEERMREWRATQWTPGLPGAIEGAIVLLYLAGFVFMAVAAIVLTITTPLLWPFVGGLVWYCCKKSA